MSAIKLQLRMPNGQFKTFTQEFVPFKKRLQYIREEAELVDRVDNNGEPDGATSEELTEYRAGFVASLFEDEKVTKDLILDGLEVENSDVLMDIIKFRVLGMKKEDLSNDGEEKKEQ
ncbi:hypothetical protein BKP56_09295 [Marinilactibacillus sp. 15R]|uniref:phage tail assembly chaperone G n=1 Tax=Marinilactibacillus sp. 15R TaxID=1911586 RepID=UPI000909BD99|nr:hypothetical protein [Marinilactibacillus sp. 15R]API89436.1 hypothetical protein BKP56_09295 [Marinilactibacillus sp. 15R]